jgi:hypothetical protein
MSPFVVAISFGAFLFCLGLGVGLYHWRGLAELRGRKNVPTDEYRYLKDRGYRRLASSLILILLGLQLILAYTTGQEAKADALGNASRDPQQTLDEKGVPVMSADQKWFMRLWGIYWIVAVVQIFLLVGLAAADAISARRYWFGLYQEMRQQHVATLQRDLAVYHQQKAQSRLRPLDGSQDH